MMTATMISNATFTTRILAAVAITAVFAIATQSATAGDREMDPAALEERTNEMRERLDLTDEQVEAIEPILIDHLEKTGAVLKEYGIDLQSGERPKERMGFREARKMKSELDGIKSKTEGALDDILDDDQMNEYRKIAEERRAKFREQIKANRG
jgi:Spy/CpxP family protein refolding chaperone